MDSIGAEVGHKMRSAIKAKLMELDCYVDEELPDYIMVMVANRRSKSQMTEDLNLFLSAKTGPFVNWLHIVLKKLKEVTVTNPEVYQKTLKRKNEVLVDEKSTLKVKKEKSQKKVKNEGDERGTSITDDLPIISNLAKNRKIIVESKESIVDDNFDIPLLSEVADSVNEQELQDLEKKIKSVKSRLGLLVDSDEEVNTENGGEITSTKQLDSVTEPELSLSEGSKPKHKRITFEDEPVLYRSKDRSPERVSGKRPSILDRLGKRPGSSDKTQTNSRDSRTSSNSDRSSSRDKSSVSSRVGYRKGEGSSRYRSRSRSPLDSKNLKNREAIKEGILSRLGVQSKVAVVKKAPAEPVNDDEEEEKVVREVQSSIKVKPRVIPSDAVQPNKNLLLKAVAEAQRSVAQTPKVGKDVEPNKAAPLERIRKDILNRLSPKPKVRDLIKESSGRMRSRLQLSSDDDDYDSEGEYVPKSVRKVESTNPVIYVPSSNHTQTDLKPSELETNKQQFIITLDGIERAGFSRKLSPETSIREDGTVNERNRSPIVFDKTEISTAEIVATRPDIPDVLPLVRPPVSVKNKERCKYWPACKHGDRCEFVHPSESCQLFPHCKFGDRCIFLHPKCKFAASCTKRDCPYDHATAKPAPIKASVVAPLQNCKFFPNCANPKCQFYHPKPCKYGKFCNNVATCTFSHPVPNSRKNFSWTAK